MTKGQIYAFMRTLYFLLKYKDFHVRFFRSTERRGEVGIDENDEWICSLNPKEEVLSTLVHEVLHVKYPDMSEKRVLAKEREIMAQLSHRQLMNMTVKLGEALRMG